MKVRTSQALPLSNFNDGENTLWAFLRNSKTLKDNFMKRKLWDGSHQIWDGYAQNTLSYVIKYFKINNAASSLLSDDFSCPHVTGFLFSSLSFSLRFARMSLCHFTKVIITLFFNILSHGRTILVLRGPYNHWSLGNEFIFFHDEKKNFLFL